MRALKIVLVLLVVVGGLAVAADRIAVYLAESDGAERVQQEYGLSQKPEIDIKGFPFLTQLAGRKFDDVDVDLSGIEASSTQGRTLRIDQAVADLHGVRVEGSAWDRAHADSAEGRVTLTYDDVSAALPVVAVSYGGRDAAGSDQVKATVGTTFLGQRFEESVRATVTVENGDTIKLRATGLDNLEGIPGVQDFVREQVNYDWRIDDLPEGIELEDIEVGEDGIEITGGGLNVDLGEAQSAG